MTCGLGRRGGMVEGRAAASRRIAARSGLVRDMAIVFAVAAWYQRFPLHRGANPVDEGWPLYAAMGLQAGRRLYSEAFFVFPPGHLLAAWLGLLVAPPGLVAARILYAGFAAALCATLVPLGRRITGPGFALLGALALALCLPTAQEQHSLFGYRYTVFSALALLCFAARIDGGRAGWMFGAGLLAGVQVSFRQDPAVALLLGIGLGLVAAKRTWREVFADVLLVSAGVLVVALPVLAWMLTQASAAELWREVGVRPIAMTALQQMPMPRLFRPRLADHNAIALAFYAALFRAIPVVYAIYLAVLLRRWVRLARAGRPFDRPLLLAIVAWATIYYARALGRADVPHLGSAIPPFALLLGHASGAIATRAARASGGSCRARRAVAFAVGAGVFLSWLYLNDAGRIPWRQPWPPIRAPILGRGVGLYARSFRSDLIAEEIRRRLPADETVLMLGPASLPYVASGRLGPGGADIVMPGTFLDEEEESRFIERLERRRPGLVLWPYDPFDNMKRRDVERTAPRLVEWVRRRYRPGGAVAGMRVLVPAGRRPPSSDRPADAVPVVPPPPAGTTPGSGPR